MSRQLRILTGRSYLSTADESNTAPSPTYEDFVRRFQPAASPSEATLRDRLSTGRSTIAPAPPTPKSHAEPAPPKFIIKGK